jgi:6-phosphogluconate dehydrogenase (decarboxylating)
VSDPGVKDDDPRRRDRREGVPADALAAALFARFSPRRSRLQKRLLSAMRFEFGGHVEQRDLMSIVI